MANGLYDNHQVSLNDNHQAGLNDTMASPINPALAGGAVALTVVGTALGLVPVVAGFLYLKDRWTKKGKKRSK